MLVHLLARNVFVKDLVLVLALVLLLLNGCSSDVKIRYDADSTGKHSIEFGISRDNNEQTPVYESAEPEN